MEPARKEAASPPFRFFRRKHDRRARALDAYAIILDALGEEIEFQLQKLLAQPIEKFRRECRSLKIRFLFAHSAAALFLLVRFMREEAVFERRLFLEALNHRLIRKPLRYLAHVNP